MITAQILFNLIPISLVMTVFLLEKYKKIAMSFKYLGVMMIIFVSISFGYFIWIPKLNIADYSGGIVNTSTEFGWQLFVNVTRMVLLAYVVYKYAKITRNVGEDTKKRIQWFFMGVITVIIGLLINLIGGMFGSIILEVFALVIIDVAIILIFKGFLM